MSDVIKERVYDARIIQPQEKYAINKGAISVNNAPFRAIASTQSQASFNIQVPSLNLFVDRGFEWDANCDFQFNVVIDATVAPPALESPVVVFGRDVAFAPNPLMSLISTLTATINNTSVTVNLADVLVVVSRLTDTAENNLSKTSPYMLDKYALYNTSTGAINNNIGSYYEARYEEVPNGAFQGVQFLNPNNSRPLSGNGNYDVGAQTYTYTNGIPNVVNIVGTEDRLLTYPLAVRLTATEPLVLSPFIFNSECSDSVGLFGVNNIQIIMNFGSNLVSRVLRNATNGSAQGRTVSNVQFLTADPWQAGSTINVISLTPSLDVPLPSKSVIPYLEYPRFITGGLGSIAPGTTATLRSQTITLPVVPDMLVIYCTPQGYVNYAEDAPLPAITSNEQGDWFLPCKKLNINFDNFSGLMSTMSTTQLYKMSVQNGLRMDYNSWSGKGRVVNPKTETASGGNVQLVGGFLVVRFAKDIALQTGTAPGVVGSFTLQLNVDVENTFSREISPQLSIMTVNSGFFETQAGSSRVIRGVVSESEVNSAPNASPLTTSAMERLVGGGFFSKLGTALGKAGELAGKAMENPAIRSAVEKGAKMGFDHLKKKMSGKGSTTGGRARLHALRE